jgi:glutathione S-transferase
MIIVHHLENSRSHRVIWLLEELGLDYRIEAYKRDPKTLLAPASLKSVHPLGKSPVVTDGHRVLAESGAIIEYLVEQNPAARLAPEPGSPDRFRYLYWLHYAEGSLMPPLFLKLIMDRLEEAPAPFFARPVLRSAARAMKKTFVLPRLEENVSFIEGELEKGSWFVGDKFTAADIQMSFPVRAALARADAGKPHARLEDFVKRIEARPAHQRAIERGGALAIAR